jgi:hypothetical protein
MRQVPAILSWKRACIAGDIAAQVTPRRGLRLPRRLRAPHRLLLPRMKTCLLSVPAGREMIHRHLSECRGGNR